MNTEAEKFTSFADAGIDTKGRTYGDVKTRCPKCDAEKRRGGDAPLSVNVDKQVWQCFRCGWTGFLANGERDWRSTLASTRPKEYVKPAPITTQRIVGAAREWLKGREIDPGLAEELGVTSDEAGRTLMFPYVKRGEVVHVKYRGTFGTDETKRIWSTKDSEPTLYGYDDVAGSETIAIVEGEMDRLAFVQAGFFPVASVPLGAPAILKDGSVAPAGGKVAFLADCEPVFANAKKIIIATDNDAPGRALADELIHRLGPTRCWRLHYPDDCKDANDVLMTYGRAYLGKLIDEVTPQPIQGIIAREELADRTMELYEKGMDTGLRLGYAHLDNIYRIPSIGALTVVTGHSSHGKSTVLDQLLVKLCERHGWHIGMFSPEQQPLELHQMQLIEQYMGMPGRDGASGPKMARDDFQQGLAWVGEHFTFVLPEEPTIEQVLDRMRILIFRHGMRGAVIDPWNELEAYRPPHMSESEFTNVAMRTLSNFCAQTGINIWLVAHPTKMPRNTDGTEAIPMLQNISGSIHFRNHADFGLSVYRPDTLSTEVDILVTKSRWSHIAEPGRVRFDYNKVTKRLTEKGPVIA